MSRPSGIRLVHGEALYTPGLDLSWSIECILGSIFEISTNFLQAKCFFLVHLHSYSLVASGPHFAEDPPQSFRPLLYHQPMSLNPFLPQDQRILDAMETRYAGEERASLLKSAVQLQWDIQRKKEQLEREQRELRHQREVARSQQHFQSQVVCVCVCVCEWVGGCLYVVVKKTC